MILAACAEFKTATDFKTGNKFRFKLNFITLTLSAPQGTHTDKDITSKILDPFLKRLRRKYELKNYVWRAERQENGNIHFHLMTDCYIHYKSIQTNWNQCQEKLKFITVFREKHGHEQPNSTDVHAVRKPKQLARYIAKYMTKLDKNQIPLNGRCWSASENILKAKFLTYDMNEDLEMTWTKATRLFHDQQLDSDFASFIPLSEVMQKRLLLPEYYKSLQNWKQEVREKKAITLPLQKDKVRMN